MGMITLIICWNFIK